MKKYLQKFWQFIGMTIAFIFVIHSVLLVFVGGWHMVKWIIKLL